MRLYAAIIILLLAASALIASMVAKPFEKPTMIDAASPGVWPTYAAASGSMIVCDVRQVQDLPKTLRAGRVVKT